MAFDGITTACLAAELSDRLTGGRIYKIAQTEKDELLLTIRPMMEKGGGQVRLYISADPSLPLCYLTEENKTAPLNAPSFCMLLRKHLQNGKLTRIYQPGLERILRFEVEHLNEMGDLCHHTLVVELMGKHSNIIFLDESEHVVDSIKHISQMVSSVREVLPGREYFVPETQGKKDPLTETRPDFLTLLKSSPSSPARFLSSTYTGFSNVISEELCFRADLTQDVSAAAFSDAEAQRLYDAFHALVETILRHDFSPVLYYRRPSSPSPSASAAFSAPASGSGFKQAAAVSSEPQEFSAVPLSSFAGNPSADYASVSQLLETFYARKNEMTRIRQKSSDLRHIVQTILERDLHKYDLQRRQLQDTEKREKYRIYGELLNAYGYQLEPGLSSVELDNYYTGEKLTVPLDKTLTPAQNARKYFDRYTKLKRTHEALSVLIQEVKAEIDHLESIKNALEISTEEGDLLQIRAELIQAGFVRDHFAKSKGKNAGKKGKTPASRPLHYRTSDGYDVYVGKNNTQNDELTFHFAAASDIWFHANDMPGSHVVLCARGEKMEDIPDRVFEEAASLAAYYSSGREQGKVEIDYLERRNVKKPGGSRPGFVVYYTNYSIIAGTDISALTPVKD